MAVSEASPQIPGNNLESAPDFQPSVEFGSQSEKTDPQVEITAENSVESSASEKDSSYKQVLSKVKSTSNDDATKADISQDASEAHGKIDRASQLQHLLDLAMTKGVQHAIATAEHLNDYYLLDKLHDQILHDEFHEKLIEKGLLKNG